MKIIKPKFFVFLLSYIFIINFCITAQSPPNDVISNFYYRRLIKNKNQNYSQFNNVNHKAINFSSYNLTGDWVVFKDWNQATCVEAENDSIVWVGTRVGLVRWNVANNTYSLFDENDGLKYTYINDIKLDKTGNLWIAAMGGIIKYSNGRFYDYDSITTNICSDFFDVIEIDPMNNLFIGYRGYLWISGYCNSGILVYRSGKWFNINFPSSNMFFDTGPFSICFYHDTLWIGTSLSFYFYYNNKLEKAPDWDNLDHRHYSRGIYSIIKDHEDSLWALSMSGYLVKYRNHKWYVIADVYGLCFEKMWSFPNVGLWLGGLGYGSPKKLFYFSFSMYRKKQKCNIFHPDGICELGNSPDNFNDHSFTSPNNQFFINDNGLYKYNGSSWRHFFIPTKIKPNFIKNLSCSPNGDMFVNTTKVLYQTNGISWDSISAYLKVNDICFYMDSLVWRGENLLNAYDRYIKKLDFDGLYNYWVLGEQIFQGRKDRFIFKRWHQNNLGIIFPSNYMILFSDLAVDKHNFIWVTGEYNTGLITYDGYNWEHYPNSYHTLPNCGYDKIFVDSKDRVWLGTNSCLPIYGITLFDRKNFYTYYSPQNDLISFVEDFTEDHLGNVLIATWGGLLIYNGKHFYIIDNTNSILKYPVILSVAVDCNSNIWIGTENGLFVYNPYGKVNFEKHNLSSNVELISIKSLSDKTEFRIKIPSDNTFPLVLQLQRGSNPYKFWTIKEFMSIGSSKDELIIIDTTQLFGDFYYRIKVIDNIGRVSFSNMIYHQGKSIIPIVQNLEYKFLGKYLYFDLDILNEQYVNRYDLYISLSDTLNYKLSKSFLPQISEKNISKYSILIDTLSSDTILKNYKLLAVLNDSTRIELYRLKLKPELPKSFYVSNNYPNPVNNITTFDIHLPVAGNLQLKIYDVLGRQIKSDIKNNFDEGYHKVVLDVSSLSSGIYFCEISCGNFKTYRKINVIK